MEREQSEEILQVLREIKSLIRISLQDELADLAYQAFGGNDEQREAFKLFCEGRSYREIGDKVKTSHATVSRWVQKWRDLGLVDAERNECAVDPKSLGI